MSTFISYAGELLTFDAKTTEDYQEAAEVTEHPIESGGFVTDHRQDRPMGVTIEGIVSESPFEGQSGPFNVLESALAGLRGLTALRYFREARHKPFRYISTRLGIQENLILQEIKTSIGSTQSTQFSLSFKQLTFPRSQTVSVPPAFVPKKPAEPVQVCGEQATTDITGNVDGANPASILRNGDDFTSIAISDFVTGPVEYFQSVFQ
jgi:hypothetical protein